jgi:hypothetical protein
MHEITDSLLPCRHYFAVSQSSAGSLPKTFTRFVDDPIMRRGFRGERAHALRFE